VPATFGGVAANGRECGRIASVCIFPEWRRRRVAAYQRITSPGRKRGRCVPRCGLGRCRLGQAEEVARLKLDAYQAGPLHGGQEHRLGSRPFHHAAAA